MVFSVFIVLLCVFMVSDSLYRFVLACVAQFNLEDMKSKIPKLKTVFGIFFGISLAVLVLEIMICFDFATLSERYIGLIITMALLCLTLIPALTTKGARFRSDKNEMAFGKFLNFKALLIAICVVLFLLDLFLT